jgi:hypothetical protein
MGQDGFEMVEVTLIPPSIPGYSYLGVVETRKPSLVQLSGRPGRSRLHA